MSTSADALSTSADALSTSADAPSTSAVALEAGATQSALEPRSVAPSEKKASLYIVGPLYDWLFFLTPPLTALLLGIAISRTDFTDFELSIGGHDTTGAGLFVGALIHAHLVAVVFRSHGNPQIFKLFPIRFVVVPVVLFLAIVASSWLAVLATVVATFWDVWHSGAQTFGFGRIYDRNAGLPPEMGRRLDFAMNQLLYAGPIFAGATMIDHAIVFEDFDAFRDEFSQLLWLVPANLEANQLVLRWTLIGGGTLFVLYYIAAYRRFATQGHRPSWLKVYLLVSTGLCSIYTWGFNSWGEAFFIMNLFHAVQYLALVWVVEGKRIAGWTRLRAPRPAKVAAFSLFFVSVALYGISVELLDPALTELWAITIVVSLMHFWYDAFIWSVRKKQI